jgi:hypothetical protein
MLSEISKRRLKYLGHANRNTKTDLMTAVLQGKVEAIKFKEDLLHRTLTT